MAEYLETYGTAISFAGAEIDPQNASPGTYTTGGVDTTLFERAQFELNVGAVGGGGTVNMAIQDSADNITFATVTPAIAINQLTLSNTIAVLGCRTDSGTRRYVRALVTVAVASCLIQCYAKGFRALLPAIQAQSYDIAAVVQRTGPNQVIPDAFYQNHRRLPMA